MSKKSLKAVENFGCSDATFFADLATNDKEIQGENLKNHSNIVTVA